MALELDEDRSEEAVVEASDGDDVADALKSIVNLGVRRHLIF